MTSGEQTSAATAAAPTGAAGAAQVAEAVQQALIADNSQFRTSVGLFATGIAVVTMPDGAGGFHGVTVNSFTSISLDPRR